jgi:RecA-family ATPase
MPRQEAFGAEVRLWKHYDRTEVRTQVDARVDELATGSALGAWFLNQPVDGIERDGSCRRIVNVTAWRYAVLETDEDISPEDWLRFLITLPLPIISITHSGGRGAHALVRTNTSSKEELEAYIDRELMPLTVYGADRNALTAYRLTRLPNCWRGEKRQMQQLYYLNPGAGGAPIYQQSTTTNNEGAEENVKNNNNGNGSRGSDEANNKPHEWLRSGKPLVIAGRITIPNEQQRQKYNNWCNENCDKPGFGAAVMAHSIGLEGRDRSEFMDLAMEGKLDGVKLREFINKYSDDLPDIESLEELEEDENIREPDENIIGLLHKGSKMVIGGPSKAKKTWLLMDLAQSISTGTKWLDVFETKQGRVLYVNLEIHKPFVKKRMLAIKKAKGIDKTNGNLDMLNLRGHAAPAEELIPKIMRKATRGNYSAIIIDPTYKVLGDRDENNAGDITNLLNEFEKLAAKLNVSVIFVAHFAKGNSNKKEVIDRISGSGVFARDPDTIMMMTEAGKSGRKSKKPKADKGGPDFKYGPFLVFLSKQGLTSGAWSNQVVKNGLVKDRDGFQRKLKEMKKEGLVPEESDENKLYTLTEKGVQYLEAWDAFISGNPNAVLVQRE